MRTQRASSTSPSRPPAPENRSVGRILDVLDLFLDGGATYTLKDVSEALGIPKSTAHGILHAMRGKGYLTVDPETKRYAVSLGLVGRLSATPTVEILRGRARRHLERLSTTLGETTKLIVFERTHSVASSFCWNERLSKLTEPTEDHTPSTTSDLACSIVGAYSYTSTPQETRSS